MALSLANFMTLIQRILNSSPDYGPLRTLGYSDRLVDLCRWMLQRNPDRRANTLDLVEHLQMRSPPSLAHTMAPVAVVPVPPPASPRVDGAGEEDLEATIPLEEQMSPPPPPPLPPHPTRRPSMGDDAVLNRRKILSTMRSTLVNAATVVQRSYRLSMERRRLMRVPTPPVENTRPLQPFERHTRIPAPVTNNRRPTHMSPAPAPTPVTNAVGRRSFFVGTACISESPSQPCSAARKTSAGQRRK